MKEIEVRVIGTEKLPADDVYCVEVEGNHNLVADNILSSNSQRISDYTISERVLPMLAWGGFTKLVKIGVPRGRNHFYESSEKDTKYKKLSFDWMNSPILRKAGVVTVGGVEYPQLVVDRMSKNIKRLVFPNHPEMWEGEGDMSDEDFRTQYLLEWLENVNPALSEIARRSLVDTSFSSETVNSIGDFEYYFGLDFAGSSENKTQGDFTSLSVFRKMRNNTKYKVFAKEWQGDTTVQVEEIVGWVHPTKGRFRCTAGYGDRGWGAPMIDDMKKEGIPIVGISYQTNDAFTGKNFKNAMCEHFNYEAENGRIKFPQSETLNKGTIFHKHKIQWGCMEKEYRGVGVNAVIEAPEDIHDDGPNSDMLGVQAADFFLIREKGSKFRIGNRTLPRIVQGPRILA